MQSNLIPVHCQGRFEDSHPIEGTLTKANGVSQRVEYVKKAQNMVFTGEKPKPRPQAGRKSEADRAPVNHPGPQTPGSSSFTGRKPDNPAPGPIGGGGSSGGKRSLGCEEPAAMASASAASAASPAKRGRPHSETNGSNGGSSGSSSGGRPASAHGNIEDHLNIEGHLLEWKALHERGLISEAVWEDAQRACVRLWARHQLGLGSKGEEE